MRCQSGLYALQDNFYLNAMLMISFNTLFVLYFLFLADATHLFVDPSGPHLCRDKVGMYFLY